MSGSPGQLQGSGRATTERSLPMDLMPTIRATLASVKQDSSFWAILDNAVGAGPFDGGCLICARAIQAVFGGQIVHLARNGQPDHYGVQISNWIVDFDGPACSIHAWIERFIEAEVVTGSVTFQPSFVPQAGIPDLPATSENVARLISVHLPPAPS